MIFTSDAIISSTAINILRKMYRTVIVISPQLLEPLEKFALMSHQTVKLNICLLHLTKALLCYLNSSPICPFASSNG